MAEQYDIVIIGGGPAGLAAALYAARARRKTVVLERAQPGGKVLDIAIVEDYPGIPDGIPGTELGTGMADQAARFDAEFRIEDVQRVELQPRVKRIVTSQREYQAVAVIIATGAAAAAGITWEFPYPDLVPESALAAGQLPLDASGHIVVNEWMETELHGVYAAGDVRTQTAQQIICAAGDGATAAIAADRYLSEEQ